MGILSLSEWLSYHKGMTYKQYRNKNKRTRYKIRQEYEEYMEAETEKECLYRQLADIGVPFFNGEPLGISEY